MRWSDYVHDTGTAIQKGSESVLHALEGALSVYGTLRGGYEMATQLGGGLRAIGATAAPAAAALALL